MVDVEPIPADGPVDAVTELAGIVLGTLSFESVLTKVTEIAAGAIRGAAEVSVTVQTDHPSTVAFSGPLALALDERQYEAGHGPCLDAIRLGQVLLVDDLRLESRWPAYTPRALQAGVRSSLSLPLPVDERWIGAMNCYSLEPNAFDGGAVEIGQAVARYAAVVLNNAGLYFTAAARAEQMAEAMASRAVIEQAKGMLMAAQRCSADEAFDVLVKVSQQSNRKLRVVAQEIVDRAQAGKPAVAEQVDKPAIGEAAPA